MNFSTEKPVIFAAFSKRNFFWRDHIIKHVLEHDRVPISAFVMFGYFLADTLPRELLIDANNDLVRRCDELWVFGEISNGVEAEISIARSLGKPIKFFSINPGDREIKEVEESEMVYEKQYL